MRWLRLLRHSDLLVLDVALHNLHLSDDGQLLVRTDPAEAALIVVHFPSQHVAEQTFAELLGSKEEIGPLPVGAMASGPTRLAFELPPDRTSVPFTVDGLLGWDELTPRLAGNAQPPESTTGSFPPGVPPGDATAIELPYRILLSPDAAGHWSHRNAPFASDRRVELWHTSLRAPDGISAPVRAVGRRAVSDLLRTALSAQNLDDVVTLTGDFNVRPKGFRELHMPSHYWMFFMDRARMHGFHYPPQPLRAERLVLSALGGTARVLGQWDYPPDDRDPSDLRTLGMPTPTLERYDHVTGMGRDQFVRVVSRGYLSTGHRAAIVETTERRFEVQQLEVVKGRYGPVAIFGADAILRRSLKIVVTESTVNYRRLGAAYRSRGLEMPLRTLRLVTQVTPPIDLPTTDPVRWPFGPPPGTSAHLVLPMTSPFWVRARRSDLEFALEATDWENRRVSFKSPLMFVPAEAVGNVAAVLTEFGTGPERRRQCRLDGQTIALADPGMSPESTSVAAESLSFTLQAVQPGFQADHYRPSWVLATNGASVHLEAVARLTGRGGARRVIYDPAYLGDGPNPAGLYARLESPEPVAFSGPGGGGLARPDARVELLSGRQGVMAETFAPGSVSTADLGALFGNARLFGTIGLADVLAELELYADDYRHADRSEDELDQLLQDPASKIAVPVLRTRPLLHDGRPYASEARFLWKPPLRDRDPTGLLNFGPGAALVLDVRTVTPLDGGQPRSDVRGQLTDFELWFAGVAKVKINRLAFEALSGSKQSITAAGFRLFFSGPLQFVDTLREVLPSDGFSDGPAIDVGPAGISAAYSLGIPSVGVGVFSLQNLSVSTALSIPFVERPASLRFAISERHQPFLVTVSLFGGGGFFAMEVSARGVEAVEATIEFGASMCLNLGVASGGVSVMAGIYFGLTGVEVTLTGYLRCGGYLSVLGLVTVSVDFLLAFAYRDKGGGRSEVWGQARVSVCVEVACFSKSVTLSLERRFAGAGGDPTFEDCVEPDDFVQYCLVFSEEEQ